ncbi:uncharacterized protein LOC103520241 [Diaphorina citri]|uniref:Uncharacterized protein LOC103520241 n=1 Tax=Diaphorina citri TaxID=121845 RepID=A0A3Q0JJ50_DIACI|nr:uncharacterized protein LOC103520241 [Diaphorina citri]
MFTYLLGLITLGVGIVVYLIKRNVFNYLSYLEAWVLHGAGQSQWFPTLEEETLDNQYLPVSSANSGSDRLIFCGGDAQGNLVSLAIERVTRNTAQVKACVWFQDGRKFETFEDEDELLPCTDWTTRGFSFQMMEPFDSWRIVINSIMKYNDTYAHINMRLMWRASSSPIYLHEKSDKNLYYSVEKRADTLWGHDEYGILSGMISVDGDETSLHYLSVKHRSWHPNTDIYVQSDYEQMFTVNFNEGVCSGHFYKCNKSFDIIKTSSIRHDKSKVLIPIPMQHKSVKPYLMDREKIRHCINIIDKQFAFNLKSLFDVQSRFKSIPPLSVLKIPTGKDKDLVDLTDDEAMSTSFVGGKAANLAILKRLTADGKNSLQVSIPSGFCVTVEAYRQHLIRNTTLSNVISQLDSAHEDDLELKCKKLHSLWMASRLEDDFKSTLASHLDENKIYAVRSSGIDEDLRSTSAAGQNESVLGVSGYESVGHSILLCWASLFSYQSVQYRRKNGIKVSSSEMCVLVQELVPEVLAAGVLFSCDPVTGNPWTSILSCNYGLGLSVVGASCDPDTFTLVRDATNDYRVQHKKCGHKENKTVYQDHVIQDVALSSKDISAFSISDQDAIRLTQVGQQIRRLFGFESDIEWVLDQKGNIHILQVRPVTSLHNWTDYELTHELDGPIHEGYDAVTFHNVAEACPGFMSPLSNTCMRVFEDAVDEMINVINDTNVISNNTMMYSYHGAINLMHTMMMVEDDPISQVIVCGQIVSTPEIHRIFLIRNGHVSTSAKLKIGVSYFMKCFRSNYMAQKASFLSQAFIIPESNNPSEMLDNIIRSLPTFQMIGLDFEFPHKTLKLSKSETCLFEVNSKLKSMPPLSVLKIPTGKDKDLVDLTDDEAMSTSFVGGKAANLAILKRLTADGKNSLQKIVSSIINEDPDHKFLSIHCSDAMEWLKLHCVKSHQLMQEFFVKFGHRGNKELDFTCETWSMNKPKVLDMIRNMVEAKINSKPNGNIPEQEQVGERQDRTVQELKNSKIANFLLPYARNIVARREITKNAAVLCFHKIRLAFLHLGKIMQRAGLLPHPRLIFFFTLYELKQLLSGRNVAVVSKALRRERLSPQWDKMIFNPQATGRPTLASGS